MKEGMYSARRVWIGLLGCLSLLCIGDTAAADNPEAKAWLQKMSSAARKYNYEGVFIYLHGNRLQAVRIVHSVEKEKEHERLVLLNGLQREVLRSNGKVTYITPKNSARKVEQRRNHPRPGFPLLSPQRIDKLIESYDVILSGQDRVAGRTTQRLTIKPRDKLRYGYRLWLDHETGLLLKTELLSRQLNIPEQFMFTTVRFLDSVPAALLEPKLDGNKFTFYRNHPDETGAVTPPSWHPAELPRGFELSAHRHFPGADKQSPMEQLIYSDGLSSVSVFIEPLKPEQKPLQGPSSLGVVNAFGATHDHFQVIALGEVPPATVRKIATSIQKNGDRNRD